MSVTSLDRHVLAAGPPADERDPGAASGAPESGFEGSLQRAGSEHDLELLDAAARGNFARLYEEHFAFAWRSLRLLGVGEELLEDAAQDVFTVVSRQLGEFAGRSSLRTWIFSIVQRTAANYRRRHRRKVLPLVPLKSSIVGSEPSPHAHAEAIDAAERIERFAEGLEPDRRALFVLVLLEEVPAPEAARALGLPLNTVYSRVRSLRTALERALSQHEVGHD